MNSCGGREAGIPAARPRTHAANKSEQPERKTDRRAGWRDCCAPQGFGFASHLGSRSRPPLPMKTSSPGETPSGSWQGGHRRLGCELGEAPRWGGLRPRVQATRRQHQPQCPLCGHAVLDSNAATEGVQNDAEWQRGKASQHPLPAFNKPSLPMSRGLQALSPDHFSSF